MRSVQGASPNIVRHNKVSSGPTHNTSAHISIIVTMDGVHISVLSFITDECPGTFHPFPALGQAQFIRASIVFRDACVLRPRGGKGRVTPSIAERFANTLRFVRSDSPIARSGG